MRFKLIADASQSHCERSNRIAIAAQSQCNRIATASQTHCNRIAMHRNRIAIALQTQRNLIAQLVQHKTHVDEDSEPDVGSRSVHSPMIISPEGY
jgi:hypothetical protein